MRTRILVFLTGLTLVASPVTPVAAAEPMVDGRLEIQLLGGYNLPQGSFADLMESGYGAGAGVAYYVNSRFSLGAEFLYNGYNVDDAITGGAGSDLSIDVKIQQYAASARFFVNDGSRRMYAKGSGGMYRGKSSVRLGTLSGSASSTDPGIAGGVGMQFLGDRNSSTFIEANYNTMFSEGETVGWFSFSLGIAFFYGL